VFAGAAPAEDDDGDGGVFAGAAGDARVAGAEEGEVAEVGAVEAEALLAFLAQHAAAPQLRAAFVALRVVAGDLKDNDVVRHACILPRDEFLGFLGGSPCPSPRGTPRNPRNRPSRYDPRTHT
jgi:hypothetical protein